MKKLVDKYLSQTIHHDLDGLSLTEAVEYLNKIKNRYEDKLVILSWEPESYGDGYELALYERREETDQECWERERTEKEYDRRAEVREREQLEALKKKFGEE